ncbi:MAG: hypothetical protein ACTHK7_06585 [Aureliella sp.]
MKRVPVRKLCLCLSLGLCAALFCSMRMRAAPLEPEAGAEPKVGMLQLLAIFSVPSIQQELDLSDEQIAQLDAIEANPIPIALDQAIEPIKAVLDAQQLHEYMRIVYQGLQVRAFALREVQVALELTPKQKQEIGEIQAALRAQLQPFQDEIKSGKGFDPVAMERDTRAFHQNAYKAALDVLTPEQRQKWRQMAKPVPYVDEP